MSEIGSAAARPRQTAELQLNRLFDALRMKRAAGEVARERLAAIGLAAMMDRADDVDCKRFRTLHSAFVFRAALCDSVVEWENRLARAHASTREQIERKWMATGALIYLQKEFPAEARHLVARWEQDFSLGPPPSCSAQAQADALLIGYVLLRTSEARGLDGIAAAAWKWRSAGEQEPPDPDSSGNGTSARTGQVTQATADALMHQVIVLHLTKELTYARLRNPALLSTVPVDQLREAGLTALKAVTRLAGSHVFREHRWSFARIEIELHLVLYLVTKSFDDLAQAWIGGYKQVTHDALKFMTSHLGEKRLDLQHTIKILADGGDLAMQFYRQYEKGKPLESSEDPGSHLSELLATHTVDALKSAIESALALLATSSQAQQLINRFWSWLLRILQGLSGDSFRVLHGAIEALPPAKVPDRIREALKRFRN